MTRSEAMAGTRRKPTAPAALGAQVASMLKGPAAGLRVHVVAATGSSNADLLDASRHPDTPACVLWALAQSQGRGRGGRRWLSDAGSLTFSLRWRFARGTAGLLGLPLAVAVAIQQGLEDLGVDGLAIKWPNDLLRGGRKLGGVLVELGGAATVIGIGLNVRLAPALAATIDQGASDLQGPGAQARAREEVLAAVLNRLVPALQSFDTAGFAPFRGAWTARAAWIGQPVRLGNAEEGVVEGRLLGVDDSGAVLLDTPGGRVARLVGDLSLRPVAP